MWNKVVVHTLDGHLIKGVTLDFVPTRPSFHVFDAADERKATKVETRDVKAVFFVRSLDGNRAARVRSAAAGLDKKPGRKLRVTFRDGEVLYGVSTAYAPEREGFFLSPTDPRENNERIYVFAHATTSVETLRPVAV